MAHVSRKLLPRSKNISHDFRFGTRKRKNTRHPMLPRACASLLVAVVYAAYSFRLALRGRDAIASSEALAGTARGASNAFTRSLYDRDDVLFIEPYHGLGNRLRAYASAAALARKTGRKLAVVWIPDVHVNASASDLFDVSSMSVFDAPILRRLQKSRRRMLAYDYNARGRKDEVIRDTARAAVYIRSAYVLQSQTLVTEADMSFELRRLRPCVTIRERVAEVEKNLPRTGRIIGVHVRMLANLDIDVPGIDALPKTDTASAAAMGPVTRNRKRCHYSSFFVHLDREIMRDRGAHILLSSYTNEALAATRKKYGARVLSVSDRSCRERTRRNAECLRASLVEFIVMSRASATLILSDWSSASELIRRLADDDVPSYSGCKP